MMGTPFLLGPSDREALKQLTEVAARFPVDMAQLREQLKYPAKKKRHMRQMTDQTIALPFNYMVTFSIEHNHPNSRSARHMSMSSPVIGRVPLPEAVWMVAEVLGFTGDSADAEENLKQCDAVWLEQLEGHGQAVNVVQLLPLAN